MTGEDARQGILNVLIYVSRILSWLSSLGACIAEARRLAWSGSSPSFPIPLCIALYFVITRPHAHTHVESLLYRPKLKNDILVFLTFALLDILPSTFLRVTLELQVHVLLLLPTSFGTHLGDALH